MRIISDFHDYYDGCNWIEENDNVNYHRFTKMVKFDIIERKMRSYQELRFRSFIRFDYRRPPLFENTFALGFCGKIYMGVINQPKPCSYDQKHECWTKPTNVIRKKSQKKYYLYDEGIKYISDFLKPVFLEYNVPVFVLIPDSYYDSVEKRHVSSYTLITNPCLNDYNFMKILDAYQTFQEISMFVGNNLVKEKEVEVPVGDDKTLAQSKGYNKWSFRKEPDNQ